MNVKELPSRFQLGDQVTLRIAPALLRLIGEIRSVSFGIEANCPLYYVRWDSGEACPVAEDELTPLIPQGGEDE